LWIHLRHNKIGFTFYIAVQERTRRENDMIHMCEAYVWE
jgi:hypothetical protein